MHTRVLSSVLPVALALLAFVAVARAGREMAAPPLGDGTTLLDHSHASGTQGTTACGTALSVQTCFQCGGSGKVHRSDIPHSQGCIFCSVCAGCTGKGTIPGDATRCPKCYGNGRFHDSPLPHSNGCIFCTACGTCSTRGWVR